MENTGEQYCYLRLQGRVVTNDIMVSSLYFHMQLVPPLPQGAAGARRVRVGRVHVAAARAAHGVPGFVHRAVLHVPQRAAAHGAQRALGAHGGQRHVDVQDGRARLLLPHAGTVVTPGGCQIAYMDILAVIRWITGCCQNGYMDIRVF
jgi:hypothetical protein